MKISLVMGKAYLYSSHAFCEPKFQHFLFNQPVLFDPSLLRVSRGGCEALKALTTRGLCEHNILASSWPFPGSKGQMRF